MLDRRGLIAVGWDVWLYPRARKIRFVDARGPTPQVPARVGGGLGQISAIFLRD